MQGLKNKRFDDLHSHDTHGNKKEEKCAWKWNMGQPHHKQACYKLYYR
jgi:hypothetical protein